MTDPIAVSLLLGSFFLLLILGTNIAFSMAIAAIGTMIYLDLPLEIAFQRIVSGLSSFSLLAVPFFILAGDIMSEGGITDRLLRLARAVVGWMRGGLAMVNIMASMFFGGISGSAIADMSSLGNILIPAMHKGGYDKDFATTVTMASSVQGMLIPPSHNMIIYAMAIGGGVSVGALFMAGLVPGVVLGVALMGYSYYISRKRNYPVDSNFTASELMTSFVGAIWGMMTIFIILSGVLTGVFTATESASVAVLWAVICALFIYRATDLKGIWRALGSTVVPLAQIMIIIGAAGAFGWVIAFLRVPDYLANSVFDFIGSKYAFLLAVNVLLLGLGLLASMTSIIVIMTPIIIPFLDKFEISYVHFGVILILNLGIGLITPPVGGVLFVGSAISKISIERLSVAMLPFYLVMIVVLLLVTFIPAISLWLPRLMGLGV
ncbi:TRAP transporter large permease [Nereida sp. MMG025]|uniref:TRAP transporter large permease n=1 Tax=Nereida sp. MMG025 TaxID=2909981 RepID=UPI001F3FCD0C|nr:TRAP transporter large permease [Nereida sp. MMG025]MCF6443541.1 TRAP transporter large permease [Nereida sp. MMG025]